MYSPERVDVHLKDAAPMYGMKFRPETVISAQEKLITVYDAVTFVKTVIPIDNIEKLDFYMPESDNEN